LKLTLDGLALSANKASSNLGDKTVVLLSADLSKDKNDHNM